MANSRTAPKPARSSAAWVCNSPGLRRGGFLFPWQHSLVALETPFPGPLLVGASFVSERFSLGPYLAGPFLVGPLLVGSLARIFSVWPDPLRTTGHDMRLRGQRGKRLLSAIPLLPIARDLRDLTRIARLVFLPESVRVQRSSALTISISSRKPRHGR
jgi:hypothetical protein